MNSERNLELHLDFLSGGGGSEWNGVSSRSLPQLQPGESTSLSLSLVPLHTGLQVSNVDMNIMMLCSLSEEVIL